MLRSDVTAPAVLCIAALLAYFNALTAAFQFDDFNVIVGNPAVHSLGAWLDSMPGIRPLLKLSYALNWTIAPGPFGFHLVNILVHVVNALLVFQFLRALRPGRSADDAVPLFAALLFALHPVQTEAVTYISGRSMSLMALFYLGSLLAYLHAEVTGQGKARIVSALLFGAALMAKESAATLPLALLLVDAVRGTAWSAQRLRSHRWHWAVLGIALLAMAALPTYRHLMDVSLATRSIADNLLTQANAIVYLAGQLVMPWRLNADPDLPVMVAATAPVILEAMLIVAILVIGFLSLGRRRWFAFAVLWFFLHLLPTNSLIPRLDVANDRQLYLASIGAFAGVAAACEWALGRAGRHWSVAGAIAILLIVLGAATIQRNQAYQTPAAFWEDTADKSPRKPRVFNNLGYAYQQEGRFEEARLAYQQAIALDPAYWKARINLSTLPPAPAEAAK